MKTYTFYWLNGHIDTARGYSLEEALDSLGYSDLAVYVLDSFGEDE